MMQTFRVTDSLRCLVLNTPKSPNLACPRSSPTKHATLQNLDLWKQALTQQDNRIPSFMERHPAGGTGIGPHLHWPCMGG
jgi:hypothetical protein